MPSALDHAGQSWLACPICDSINHVVASVTHALHTSGLRNANNMDVISTNRSGSVSKQGVRSFEVSFGAVETTPVPMFRGDRAKLLRPWGRSLVSNNHLCS